MCKTYPIRRILFYFMLLDAIVDGIVFVISSSDRSLLVCRNAIGFYILILYPATIEFTKEFLNQKFREQI